MSDQGYAVPTAGLSSSFDSPTIGENEPHREPQVGAEIGMLTDSIEKLGAVIGVLDGRLRHVARGESPGAALRSETDDVLVPQAERIRGLRRSVVAQTDQLQDLLDRLEV